MDDSHQNDQPPKRVVLKPDLIIGLANRTPPTRDHLNIGGHRIPLIEGTEEEMMVQGHRCRFKFVNPDGSGVGHTTTGLLIKWDKDGNLTD
jgi:hypothetical protein